MKIDKNPIKKYNFKISEVLDFFRNKEKSLNDTYCYKQYENKMCMLRSNRINGFSFADLNLCLIVNKEESCQECIFSINKRQDGIKLIKYIDRNK